MTVAALRHPPGPRAADNLSGSFALALLMHGLLFGAMTLAVQWRTQPAAPIVAELWSALPAQPEPVPQVAPPPPPPPPPPKQEAEPEKPADIVVKQEKKPEPKKEEKKPEPKKEEKKPEPKKDEKKAEPRKADEKPRPQTDLERIMAQAGTAAPAATAGAPAGASGVRGSDSGYSARVIGCIRPHIVFVVPEGTSANVYAEFRIELLPDASVAGVRLTRASGLPGYDAAAERAIRRCDPFPRKSDGSLDRTIDVRMYPVEPR